jgi:hypothetical protein
VIWVTETFSTLKRNEKVSSFAAKAGKSLFESEVAVSRRQSVV